MASFETKFASVGRWLDDQIWKFRSRTSTEDKLRDLTTSVQDRVRSVAHATQEKIQDVRHNSAIERDDPKTRRVLSVVACVLLLGAGLFAGRWLWGGGDGATPEEATALAQIRARSAEGESAAPAPDVLRGQAPPPPAQPKESRPRMPKPGAG